jgi:hypothetical protein
LPAQELYPIFSFSDFGLAFCCFSCAQVDVWYFWITLSAVKSQHTLGRRRAGNDQG